MTESSSVWGGTTVGDATAAAYDDQEWAVRDRFLFLANDVNAGVLPASGTSPNEPLAVTPTGPASMSVNLEVGAALVRGTLYRNDAQLNKAIAANASGNPRIDTLVLNKDYAAQTIRALILQGTPAGSPVAPTLTQTDGVQWQLPIADIAVANGAATIVAANITPRWKLANYREPALGSTVYNNVTVTTTSATFVDADATNRKVVITPHTSRVRVRFNFNGLASGTGRAIFDIYSVSLNARAGHVTEGLATVNSGGLQSHIAIEWIFSNLTPGVPQEFRLQYRSDVAGQNVSAGALFIAIAQDI